jgi:hypothetical protein
MIGRTLRISLYVGLAILFIVLAVKVIGFRGPPMCNAVNTTCSNSK